MAAMSPIDYRLDIYQNPLELLDREIELTKAVKKAAMNSFREVNESYKAALQDRKVSEIGTKSENSLPNAVNNLYQKLLSKGQRIELESNRLRTLEGIKSRALLFDNYISFVLVRINIVISEEVMSFVISQFGDNLKTLLAQIELSKFFHLSEEEVSALYSKLNSLIENLIYIASNKELQVLMSKPEFAAAFTKINEKFKKLQLDLINERERLNQERGPVSFFSRFLGFRLTQITEINDRIENLGKAKNLEIANKLLSEPQSLNDQTITTLQSLLNVIVEFEKTHS